jgi:drug/metabolite transporter (DMT)-like permease
MLFFSALAYAVGLVAQSAAARRSRRDDRNGLSLLGRLARDPVYAFGFGAQVIGFGLAFLARGTLPLYLVQGSTCASVAFAALIGAVVLGWRVTRPEMVVLAMITAALLLLAAASEPSTAAEVGAEVEWLLAGVLMLCVVLAVPAWSARGGVPLACLAGIAFAVLAVASRPLISAELSTLAWNPLVWLTLLSAVTGQLMLAAALQRGSTTSTGASMDAVTAVLASAAGFVFLGDQIAAGKTLWVVGGLVVIVGGVLAMARAGTVIAGEGSRAQGAFVSASAGGK